jgi:hypothetical protein
VIPQGVDNVTLANLIVQGPEKAGAGDGIHMVQQGTPSCIELHDVVVWGCGRDGIHIESTTHSVDWLIIDNCTSNSNGRHGLFIHASYGPNLRSGFYAANGRCGIVLEACGAASLRDLSIEGNQRTGAPGDNESQLLLSGGLAHNVDACRFENWAKWQGARAAVTVDNVAGVRIVGCSFVQPDRTPSRGVVYRNHARACELGLNTWTRVTQRTDIDATCTTIEVREQQATFD